jgi:hypothetical protein
MRVPLTELHGKCYIKNGKRKCGMPLTLEDIKDKLKTLPEIDLLEVLEISSEDLVDRFSDKIEDKMEYLINDLEDEEYE